MSSCAECWERGHVCGECGCCDDCCDCGYCDEEVAGFDADELGEDPETDIVR